VAAEEQEQQGEAPEGQSQEQGIPPISGGHQESQDRSPQEGQTEEQPQKLQSTRGPTQFSYFPKREKERGTEQGQRPASSSYLSQEATRSGQPAAGCEERVSAL